MKKWLGMLLVIAFVVYAGLFFEAWTGFPKGVDVYARMTRVKYILDFFPHVNWQYHWANGLPTFTTEAPFFYYLAAVLVKLTGISIETSMIVLGFFTFAFLGIGVYGYVYTLTKNILAAIAAAFLVLSSFSTWNWMVLGGIYPRIFAVGLMAIVFWLLVWLFEKDSKIILVSLIGCLSALMASHILIGFFTFVAIFFHLVFFKLARKQKLKIGAKIFGGSLALSAFLYLPLVVGLPSSSGRFLGVISPVLPLKFTSLWDYGDLGPIILPTLGLALWLNRRWSTLFKPLLTMLAIFTFYGFIGHTGLPGKYYYINGFIPFSAACFLAIFASLITGISLGGLLKNTKRKKRRVGLILAGAAILGAVIVVPANVEWQQKYYDKFDRLFIYDSSHPRRTVKVTQEMGTFPDKEFQYRFAPFDALEAVWFNYVYQTPQERDYYGQGILHPDWRYWFEQTLWNPEFSEAETKMALDWFAIRWFSESVFNAGRATIKDVLAEQPSRYFNHPDYQFIQHAFIDWALLLRFEIPKPRPILEATNSLPILLIGDEAGYSMFFRNLSLVNLSSQKLIPLLGEKFIDDYQLADLSPFKIIVLYNYQYHQEERAYQLLQNYVNQGGNLIWETAGSPDTQGSLPEPAPVSQLKQEEVKKEWDFNAVDHPSTTGINVTKFSSLVYNDDVWKLSLASSDNLRQGAEGLLGKGGEWAAVTRSYGQGKIVWTGFNFLYHISTSKNQEEAKLLAKMLNWLYRKEEIKSVAYQADFIHPEKREIQINNQARGVLFKENYHQQWHAYLDNEGKQKIFYAGPGMMYVLLPDGISSAKLTFKYQPSLAKILGILISVLTFLSLVYYLFRGKLPIQPSFVKTIAGWWDKEE